MDEDPTDTGADEIAVVDAALAALEGLEDLGVDQHLAAYEQAHRELRAALEV